MAPEPRERVAILGLGLIGGSLGLAWRAQGAAAEVIGYDLSPRAAERALALGAVDRVVDEPAEAAAAGTVIVLAAPVSAILELAPVVAAAARPGAILTDVGSTKVAIAQRMTEALPPGVVYVGGHPMAGSEAEGIEAADPYLFQNAVYVLTPEPGVPETVLRRLSALVEATGAQVVTMTPDRHDRIVAAVSHLPQVVAVALVNAVAEAEREEPGLLDLAAGGFRDTTRISGSPPGMWLDILLSNRDPVLGMIGRFREGLSRLERALREGDRQAVYAALAEAREVRGRLPRRSKGLLPTYFDLVVTVPDRPGVIAAVAGVLGQAGINIEDIEILRLREGEGGTIRLGFATAEEWERGYQALAVAGYRVQRR